MKHLTAEALVRAKEAYQLCRLLGHPGFKKLCLGLRNGNYPHIHLTEQNVINAQTTFGKCILCLEGKMAAPKELLSVSPPATVMGQKVF